VTANLSSKAVSAQYNWTPEEEVLRNKLLNDADFWQMLKEYRAFAHQKITRMSKMSKSEIAQIALDYQKDKRGYLAKRHSLRLKYFTQEEILDYETKSNLARIKWLKKLTKGDKKVLLQGLLSNVTFYALTMLNAPNNMRVEDYCYTTEEICDCLSSCEDNQYVCEAPFDAGYQACIEIDHETTDFCDDYFNDDYAGCMETGATCATDCL
jgi:hypothetical protein